jgi:hypothetical protein
MRGQIAVPVAWTQGLTPVEWFGQDGFGPRC